MEQTDTVETTRYQDNVSVDAVALAAEAQGYVEHPDFDAAMRAFCRGLADFYSLGFFRRTGVVDTITWATAVMLLYLDAYAPDQANASRLVSIFGKGGLSGATAARNAIELLRQGGMVESDRAPGPGRAHRLRPTPALLDTMHRELSVRLSAMEPVIAWPRPADEWARREDVLMVFVRRNVEAFQGSRYTLYENFPEIRAFMDRRCGYAILMESLGRVDFSLDGASGILPLSEISGKFAVSRAHMRKLFGAAAARGWLTYESGGRLTIPPETLGRFRLWFGHEFAWMRKLVERP